MGKGSSALQGVQSLLSSNMKEFLLAPVVSCALSWVTIKWLVECLATGEPPRSHWGRCLLWAAALLRHTPRRCQACDVLQLCLQTKHVFSNPQPHLPTPPPDQHLLAIYPWHSCSRCCLIFTGAWMCWTRMEQGVWRAGVRNTQTSFSYPLSALLNSGSRHSEKWGVKKEWAGTGAG